MTNPMSRVAIAAMRDHGLRLPAEADTLPPERQAAIWQQAGDGVSLAVTLAERTMRFDLIREEMQE